MTVGLKYNKSLALSVMASLRSVEIQASFVAKLNGLPIGRSASVTVPNP
jgi:hypothetical protein